jgi:hypothetical protein
MLGWKKALAQYLPFNLAAFLTVATETTWQVSVTDLLLRHRDWATSIDFPLAVQLGSTVNNNTQGVVVIGAGSRTRSGTPITRASTRAPTNRRRALGLTTSMQTTSRSRWGRPRGRVRRHLLDLHAHSDSSFP